MASNTQNWDISAQLAVQMYTVRDFTGTEKEFIETLSKISSIGYTAVQLSAVGAMNGESPEVSAKTARKYLDDFGLKVIATHRSWEHLQSHTEAEIEFHEILGCSYTAIGGVPGTYGDDELAGYRRWTEQAKVLAEALKPSGLRFGLHNHAHEFEKFGKNRETLYQIVADEGKPDVYLELDVYWAAHAGLNPVKLIETLHGRLPVVHVKDSEVYKGVPVMAPVGEGNLDWSEIIPALTAAGTQWFAVEQDVCRRDPFDCLKSSYNFLSGD